MGKNSENTSEGLPFFSKIYSTLNSMKFLMISYHKGATVSSQNGFCRSLNVCEILMLLCCGTFYFDLADGVKIQKLAGNVHFGKNVAMVIFLRTRVEYPFADRLLSH